MRQILIRLLTAMLLVVMTGSLAYGQGGTSSALSGTVVDASGGVIPGAEIAIKNNATGTEAKTLTSANGTFSIPLLSAGTYTATVSVPNFKQAVIKDIVLVAGAPSNIRVTLEVGGSNEVVTVQANAEIVQSQTATVTTTMNIEQISSLPLASRSVMDFLIFLPGANTTGGTRGTTFAGLPNSTINITIDGINTQDNFLKGSAGGDGFFSMIMPRIDAIEQVTVSTATPGAEAAGQGAVQIKFVTRSGNNEYHGSLYEYMQNSWLNANSWFYNRDRAQTYDGTSTPCTAAQLANEWDKCKAPRNKAILNQFGFRVGGPITLPKKLFGPLGFSGKDRAFFFFNYEESQQPFAQTRTRTIFSEDVWDGVFPYTVGGTVQKVNLFTLAAANGQTATWDPTVQKLLADIRAVSKKTGTVKARTDPHLMDYQIVNSGIYVRKTPTARFDFNLTSKHRLEASWNYMWYVPSPDTTNSADWAYPGFPNYGTQGSHRWTASVALRSTITPRLVNEARFGLLGGVVLFWPDVNVGQFATTGIGNQDGFGLSLSPMSNAYTARSPERRDDPNETFEDNLNWNKGSHSFSFGGTFTSVGNWIWDQDVVPSIGFGVDTTYDPARIMFDSANGTKNFPSASNTQISNARSIYALLTGRVTSIGGNGVLSEVNDKYSYNGAAVQRGHMRELGFFVADSWKMRPGLTINYGVRWELQLPFVPLNSVYTYNTMDDVWGISGKGNLFKPGTMTGTAPTYKQFTSGSPAYNNDYKSIAPSFGFAWSPKADAGWLGHILGGSGSTVLRGGFSIAYNRNGMYDYTRIFGSNPGVYINATRNVTNGILVTGTDTWPVLFRDKSRLSAPTFAATPAYPLQSTSISDSVNAFDPNLRTPYTMSWSFGLQREISRDMVIEVRYMATRNLQPWERRNLNEQNIVENGFLNEFKLAMANLQANLAASGKATFAYTNAPGTSPLPITLAYFSGIPQSQAGDTTKYTSSNFTSTTYVNQLALTNPNPGSYATSLWNNLAQRNNAQAAGIAANIFMVNPTVASGGARFTTNGGYNSYDSMVIELRRRMSRGLLVQANYTWSKGLDSSRLSFRTPYETVTGSTLPHAFKVNWVYELPFGRGRALFNSSRVLIDRLIGGFEFQGTGRIQAGNLLNFGNVRLIGMTADDLRGVMGLRFDDVNRQIYFEPEDIRLNTIKAYNTSAITSTGYSTAYGVPGGRYIAPANTANCIQIYNGQCAPLTLYGRGPSFWNFDLSLVKKIRFTEQKNFELRGEFLNAFNKTNFTGATCASAGDTCGQVTGSNGNPRNIQIVLRLNF
jgi:hypothetical protein